MKPNSALREISLVTGALLVAMMLVMWALAPNADCVMPPEAGRRLVLARTVDREHLVRDLESAARVAKRYAVATTAADDRESRLSHCEELLTQEISARHGLPADLVRNPNGRPGGRP